MVVGLFVLVGTRFYDALVAASRRHCARETGAKLAHSTD